MQVRERQRGVTSRMRERERERRGGGGGGGAEEILMYVFPLFLNSS